MRNRLMLSSVWCLGVLGAVAIVLPAISAAPEPQRLLDRSRDWDRRSDSRGPAETEVVERTVAVPANGTLQIRNFSGEIRITPTSGRDVVLTATRRASREALDHIALEVSSSASTVTIEANRRDPAWTRSRDTSDVVETDMAIQVPASTDLDISVFSSDVIIEGVNADQRIKTFSGKITVRDLKGEIDASTFNGDIRVTLDPKSAGNVSFDTFSGRLDSDTAVSVVSTRRRGNGAEGTLAGGSGPRMRFHTFSGNVELRTR